MAVNKKTFEDFKSLNLFLDDNNTSLKYNKFTTAQGIDLKQYDLLDDINDFKTKNYTQNILTNRYEVNDFIDFKSQSLFNNIDINTKLIFSGLSPASAANYLSFSSNQSESDSTVSFVSRSNVNTNFILDFKDDENCVIKVNDGGFLKHLTLDYDNYIFKSIDTETENLSNYFLNYDYDEKNGYLSLFTTLSNQFFIIAPNSGVLSANQPNNSSAGKGVIKLSQASDKINTEKFSNFVFYDYKNNHKTSNETITGQEFNFLSYFPYEVTSLSSNGEYTNNLRFFNLKNQVSNLNNINPLLPLENSTLQKDYTTILNIGNAEKSNENLIFGYNFYTKEYKFIPDKTLKFTLPDSLFPYQKANINDANLVEGGSYGAKSPYFSDKIYKLLDNNLNVNSDVADINQIFLLQDGSSFLIFEENDFKLLKQEYGLKTTLDNSGHLLCSWLSGDENGGLWYDRYYFPRKYQDNFFEAISGSTNQVFTNVTQAEDYFNRFGITEIFYDIESNLVFQPNSTYFYSRIGNNYITKIIDGQNDKLAKDTLTLMFSGNEIVDQNTLKFNDNAFDVFNFDDLQGNNFNVSFELNLDSLSSLRSNQIIGNLYEDGFSLKNDFYFTPFVIIPNDNKLLFYNNEFELIKTNFYPTLTSINDVFYLEQHNNLVLMGNDKIIKSGYNGEIIDINTSGVINNDVKEIANENDDRLFKGYNKAFILNNKTDTSLNNFHKLELNNLSLSSTNSPSLTGKNSIIDTDIGIVGLSGYKGKKLNDIIGVSIQGNEILYENYLSGGTFSNPLSTSKTIYDINVYDEKLYIQSFDSSNNGFINVFNNERELLKTYFINNSAVSGYKLDFINEDKEIKLLSFSIDQNKKIYVDKFNLSNSLSSTYFLNISSNDIVIQGKTRNINPVNFESLENKYKQYQDKLNFVLNVKNFLESNYISVEWQDAGPPIYTSFIFGSGSDVASVTGSIPEGLSGWDGKFDTSSLQNQDINFESILPVNNLKLNNRISINFNLVIGEITFYLNARKLGTISFIPNKFPVQSLKFPDLFINTQNIKNNSISKLLNTNEYFGNGGNISNFKIYNNTISEDLIKYLYLENTKIDEMIFDIPCGSRNNIEEINSLYNYNIPGYKNNNFKVYVKNGRFDENTKDKIIEFVNKKIASYLPVNVNNIEYNFDLN